MADSVFYLLAHDILDAVVNHFTAEGIDLPDRRYAHFGDVAIDGGLVHRCEQLVVTYAPGQYGGLAGSPQDGPLQCEQLTVAQYEVWLSRCVPTFKNDKGDPPDPDVLDASGMGLMIDAHHLNRALYLGRKDMFVSQPKKCRMIRLEDQVTQGPEGGFSSVVQPLSVEVF